MDGLLDKLVFRSNDVDEGNDSRWEADVNLFLNWLGLQLKKNRKDDEDIYLTDILESPAVYETYEIGDIFLYSDGDYKMPIQESQPERGLYNPKLELLLQDLHYDVDEDFEVNANCRYQFTEESIAKATINDLFELLEEKGVWGVRLWLVRKENEDSEKEKPLRGFLSQNYLKETMVSQLYARTNTND